MNIVTDIILPLALAFIMFVLGLGLTGADFLRVIKQPCDFLGRIFFLTSYTSNYSFYYCQDMAVSSRVGNRVMIIAAAPGGVTSNLLTSFAKGDVALSISLTAIISLLCVFTIPFIVLTSVELLGVPGVDLNISLVGMSRDMFLIVTVPVILGMLLRKISYKVATKFEPIAKKYLLCFLYLYC